MQETRPDEDTNISKSDFFKLTLRINVKNVWLFLSTIQYHFPTKENP